jgi:hypothetical protein
VARKRKEESKGRKERGREGREEKERKTYPVISITDVQNRLCLIPKNNSSSLFYCLYVISTVL